MAKAVDMSKKFDVTICLQKLAWTARQIYIMTSDSQISAEELISNSTIVVQYRKKLMN